MAAANAEKARFADHRARLKDIIADKSFRYGEEFTLASGQRSRYYFNMKPTMMDAEGSYLMALAFVEKAVELGADALGGLEMGAVPIAAAAAPVSFLQNTPLVTFFVRKAAKAHGTQDLIEGLKAGETLSGRKVVVVEDVTTTGGSALKAIDQIRAAGATVGHLITLVDREEGAEANLAGHGIALHAIFRKSEFAA